MSPREQQIIRLHDRGTKAPAIAGELGLSAGYVENVIGRYPITADCAFKKMVIAGTADLLAALLSAHPELASSAAETPVEGHPERCGG